ncbi:glycosyltransferase [Mucilaginibacter puniceus]
MQKLAPIALFVYNRPDHTRRTITSLQRNVLADESRLFIFSDAAKTEADIAKVNEVRKLVKETTGFKSVKVIERTENMGLAKSIISGVTQLVNEYGNTIVFEDDLLSSPYTLQYFNEALSRYADEEKVMHISAYMYNLKANNLPETFFFRAISSWGWATWARAWNHFEPDIEKLTAQFDAEKKRRFTIDHTMNFWRQVREFKAGKNNSWAIRWYLSVFLNNGLSLNPSQSLINNIGHDGTGIHSNIEDMYTVRIAQKPITNFPGMIEEHPAGYEAIKYFFKHRKGSLWQRGIRYLVKIRAKYGRQ